MERRVVTINGIITESSQSRTVAGTDGWIGLLLAGGKRPDWKEPVVRPCRP